MPSLLHRKRQDTSPATSDGGALAVVAPPPPSPAAPTQPDDLYSTLGVHGCKVVSDPPNPELDICFVHGLTGNRETTWTHSNGTFWPPMLKDAFPKARIMVYGYDANVVGLWHNASSENLRGYGNTLAISIANTRPEETQRPIYFIAHSLGGLVVEAAVLSCFQPNEPRLHPIPSCIGGIIFMGTPHAGSYLAKWGWVLARFLNEVWRSNHKVLEVLKQNSDFLKEVEQDFQRQLRYNLTDIKIICFYETVPVSVAGFVVPEESASLPAYTSCGIDANHMDMTKFAGAQDAGFILVRSQLLAWTQAPTPESQITGAQKESTAASAPKPEIRTDAPATASGTTYSGTFTAGKSMITGAAHAARDLNM